VRLIGEAGDQGQGHVDAGRHPAEVMNLPSSTHRCGLQAPERCAGRGVAQVASERQDRNILAW
jgi:hypothetical protein